MSCHKFQKELVAYLDGELEESLRSQLDQHLGECSACRAAKEALELTLQQLDSLPATELSPEAKAKFWERFEREKNQNVLDQIFAWLHRPRIAMLLGAGVAAGIVAVMILVRPAGTLVSQADKVIASHIELFDDYETIRNLDVLEDIEFIEALDDEGVF